MSEQNMQIARDALIALIDGNTAELDRHPGYWQAKQYFPIFFAPFADLTVEIVQQIAEGDVVATRATLAGTHQAEWLGIAPTGQRVRCDIFQFDQIAGGRVIEHNATADIIALLAQLGAIGQRPDR